MGNAVEATKLGEKLHMASRKWDGTVRPGGYNFKPRPSAAERVCVEQWRKEGYFVLGRGWPDFCLVRLKEPWSNVPALEVRPDEIREIRFVEVKGPSGGLGRSQVLIAKILAYVSHDSACVEVVRGQTQVTSSRMTNNNNRVGMALDLLRTGLTAFVEREFTKLYGAQALAEAQRFMTTERLGTNRSFGAWNAFDVRALLRLMWIAWNDVFRKTLRQPERTLVSELREVGNQWAHQGTFSTDDAYRALDSAERLLASVSAPQADEVTRMKKELWDGGSSSASGLPSGRPSVNPHLAPRHALGSEERNASAFPEISGRPSPLTDADGFTEKLLQRCPELEKVRGTGGRWSFRRQGRKNYLLRIKADGTLHARHQPCRSTNWEYEERGLRGRPAYRWRGGTENLDRAIADIRGWVDLLAKA